MDLYPGLKKFESITKIEVTTIKKINSENRIILNILNLDLIL